VLVAPVGHAEVAGAGRAGLAALVPESIAAAAVVLARIVDFVRAVSLGQASADTSGHSSARTAVPDAAAVASAEDPATVSAASARLH